MPLGRQSPSPMPTQNVALTDPQTGLVSVDWFAFFAGIQIGPLKDFANDAAAAAGGVGLNGFYKTGSTVKIRVT
jgi:hypothetical protein